MTTEEFLTDLNERVYCRLARSQIHGIGVFAVRRIPKGTNPMRETRETDFLEIPVETITADPSITPELKKYVIDMCPENDGKYAVPNYSLNEIGISYFLNHSDHPNMDENDGDFTANRDIEVGEELVVNYGSYGKLNLA